MSLEEAADYLYETLTSLGLAPGPRESNGAHSFKATLITWSDWCPTPSFTPLERQLMGHHVRRAGSSSTLIFSRQYYLNLAGKILAMFQAIRRGAFNPDAESTEGVAAVAAAQSGEALAGAMDARRGMDAQAGDADVASSESAESVVEYEPMPGMGASVRPPLECTVAELRVHTLSGILHRLRDATTFFAAVHPRAGTEILMRMMPRIQTPAITAGELYRALIEAEPKSEEVDRKRAVCASSVAGLRPVAADPPGWPVLRPGPPRRGSWSP